MIPEEFRQSLAEKRDRAYRSSNESIRYLLSDISRMERKDEPYSYYG